MQPPWTVLSSRLDQRDILMFFNFTLTTSTIIALSLCQVQNLHRWKDSDWGDPGIVICFGLDFEAWDRLYVFPYLLLRVEKLERGFGESDWAEFGWWNITELSFFILYCSTPVL